MKKSKLTLLILLVFALSLGPACARKPTEKRTAKILAKYFKKYGKEYPHTIYGKSKVTEVDVTDETEIHKNLVAVDAFVTLDDGNVQRINATVERGPFGWRFVSWENATGM